MKWSFPMIPNSNHNNKSNKFKMTSIKKKRSKMKKNSIKV